MKKVNFRVDALSQKVKSIMSSLQIQNQMEFLELHKMWVQLCPGFGGSLLTWITIRSMPYDKILEAQHNDVEVKKIKFIVKS